MTITMNIHSQDAPFEIIAEYPDNGNSLTLSNGEIEITIYLSLEQWWTYRRLPRAGKYRFTAEDPHRVVKDLTEADKLAVEHYAKNGGTGSKLEMAA